MLSHPSRAVAAASLVIALAGPRPAEAHEGTLQLRPVGDPLQFVEWRPGAQGVLTAQRDHTRRKLFVTATPGAKVSLPVGCPPKSYGNWEVSTDDEPVTADSGEYAFVRATSAPRSSGDGTFVIELTAPQRDGAALEFDVACVKVGPGVDGVIGTADDVFDQPETLRAQIVTRTHRALAGSSDEGSTREHDEGEGAEAGVPVSVRLLAAALARSTVHPDSWRYAGGLGVEFDPLLGDAWWKSLPVGARWMYLRAAEAMGSHGELFPAVSNAGFVTAAWRPGLARPIGPGGPVRVSGRAQLGFGGGVTSGRRVDGGRPVETNSEAQGLGVLGIELEGDRFGAFTEVGVTYSDAEALNTAFAGAGLTFKF